MHVHIHTHTDLGVCRDFHSLLPMKCLVIKQMLIEAQVCPKHCIVLAVLRIYMRP